ncbi:hypothetical protein [Acidicapsa acidisoli]|uniref:hypothetical protein n=1 Tax=Acidicapsa acidisoli TaxID=1615681 RepID=UPI0021DF804F|nr:hypothetical protein [Acidicapsa acidisoli]
MGILNLFVSRKATSNSQSSSAAGLNRNPSEVHQVGIHSKPMDMETYHASDEKEWLKYLGQALRTYRKPGLSMQEEYQLWRSARAESRAMAAANARSN